MQEIFNIPTASIKYTSRKYANKKKKFIMYNEENLVKYQWSIGFVKDAVDKKESKRYAVFFTHNSIFSIFD